MKNNFVKKMVIVQAVSIYINKFIIDKNNFESEEITEPEYNLSKEKNLETCIDYLSETLKIPDRDFIKTKIVEFEVFYFESFAAVNNNITFAKHGKDINARLKDFTESFFSN